MLKIYSIDGSWRGGSIYVCESKEEAMEFFKTNYCWTDMHTIDSIEEHEIVPRLSIEFVGDR